MGQLRYAGNRGDMVRTHLSLSLSLSLVESSRVERKRKRERERERDGQILALFASGLVAYSIAAFWTAVYVM